MQDSRRTVWLREASPQGVPCRAAPCKGGSPDRSVGGSLSWTDSPGRQRRDWRDAFTIIAPFLVKCCGRKRQSRCPMETAMGIFVNDLVSCYKCVIQTASKTCQNRYSQDETWLYFFYFELVILTSP